MKNFGYILILALALSFGSRAQTPLFQEDFSDGNTDGWTLDGGSLSITNDAALGGGNAMQIDTTSKNRWAEHALVQAVTLSADDSISVTLDYRFAGAIPAQNQALDIRFVNSASGDYMAVGINPAANDGNSCIWKRSGDTNEGKFDAFIHDASPETITFSITHTLNGATDQATFDASWTGDPAGPFSGGETSAVTNPAVEFQFDTFAIGFVGTTQEDFLIDNITVSTTADLTETPTLTLDESTRSFQIAPGATQGLPLLIRNTGFDATNITASLSTTSAWFSVLTSPIATTSLAGSGGEMTNSFSVAVATNTPTGEYADILSLNMVSESLEGTVVTSTAPVSLSILSTNGPTQYVSPNSSDISIAGTWFINRETDSVWFQRHTDEVLALTFNEGGFNDLKARTDTGIRLLFKTDSDQIKLSFRMLDFNNRSAGYGIYENGALIEEYDFPKDTNTPENVFTITSTTPGAASVYEVCLPSWANVEFFDMRIDDGASMLAYTPPVQKTYIALGDSITHGTGQQSYTHKTYPFQLSKLLGVDLYNLAIGGSVISQPVAEMLAEVPQADVITLLIGYNDWNSGDTAGEYETNLTAFVSTCRSNQPNADIFCVTPTFTTTTNTIPIDDFRAVVSNLVTDLQTAGDSNIYLIRGETIITNADQLVDAVHLDPDGATDMANGMYDIIDPIVNAPANGITHAHDDSRFDYDGVLFPKHHVDYVQLNRFSDPILAASEGFNPDRALVPSCVVIRFTTASPTFTAHFQTLETDKALKMPQYAVYRNGTTDVTDYEEFRFDGDVTNPVFTVTSESPGTNVMYEILLPSMNATAFKGLTLEDGFDLVTNAPYERPVHVAIGDSITMNAGFQSMSYETYTWKFARSRGMEVYNIAVGGAVTAPDWGSMFPSLNPEFITVLFGINDWNTANDLTVFRGKYMELLDNIRADHPGTPLFCITLVAVNDKVDPVGDNGVTVNAFRREIIDMVNERRTAGDSSIYLIDGHSTTDSDDLLDSFHFDRAGTTKFAANLDAAIDEILVNSNYTGVEAIPTNTLSDWAARYGVNAAVTNYLNDADSDGQDNLVEFALGGNPTNGLRAAAQEFKTADGIRYVYRRRRNANALDLTYTPQFSSNLTAAAWSTNGISETGSGTIDSEFESVTNRIDAGDSGFIRLNITTTP